MQTEVTKEKTACEPIQGGLELSRRSMLGLLAGAISPAVALAEEEPENGEHSGLPARSFGVLCFAVIQLLCAHIGFARMLSSVLS